MSLKQKKYLTGLIVLLSLGMAVVPFFASAAGLVKCGNEGQSRCTVGDLFSLVAIVINYLISMAGVYAVFWIVIGGFRMVAAAGGEEAYKKGKSTVTNAIIGFVWVLVAFVVVNSVVNLILPAKNKIDLTKPVCYFSPSSSACKGK